MLGRAFRCGWDMTTWPDLDVAHPTADLCRWVAHDLRQPVAAILTLVSATTVQPQLPEPARQRLAQIGVEAEWMSQVIAELLAGSGADGAEAEPVDVAGLVRAAVDSELLTYTGRIVLRQPDGGPRYVMAASTRLRRAISNVLANATRAAGPDGEVELAERPDREAEVIAITDDGPGPGRVARGHGIGLQIAWQMLTECGGHMEIERLAAGRTRVRILLPIIPDSRRAGGR
jgi:signal transduction histidine kinase